MTSPLPPAVAEELGKLVTDLLDAFGLASALGGAVPGSQLANAVDEAVLALHHFVAERSQPNAAWIAWLESEAVRLEAWQPAPDPIGPLHGAGLGTAAKSFAQHYRNLAASLRVSPSGEPQREWEFTVLISALENYGKHHPWCRYVALMSNVGPCDCGLEKVLAEARTLNRIPEGTGSADKAVAPSSTFPGEPQRPHTWSPEAIEAAMRAGPQDSDECEEGGFISVNDNHETRAMLDAAWSVDFGGAQQETKP